MKKTCTGCRALKKDRGLYFCELGYAIKDGKKVLGIVINTTPLEDCPKPKTNSEYVYHTMNK